MLMMSHAQALDVLVNQLEKAQKTKCVGCYIPALPLSLYICISLSLYLTIYLSLTSSLAQFSQNF